jgi:hypothetical protein
MQLPHADEAEVPESKVAGYLLCPVHPSGRSKARFFMALGFRTARPLDLQRALLQLATTTAVSSCQHTAFGTKYLIDVLIRGPAGRAARVRTVWFVETGDHCPRFVTAYPMPGTKR